MSFSLLEVWREAGIVGKGVFVILALMSVYSLALVAERLRHYARARRASAAYVAVLASALGQEDLERAVEEAPRHPHSHVARVVSAGLGAYLAGRAKQAAGRQGVDVVEAMDRSLERVREREIARLKRGLSSIATVGSTAPFVGLFGTVVGIIKAFTSMSASGAGGLAAVSGDIAEALVATGLGLFVAIPAVALYNALSSRVDEMRVDMDDVSGEVIAHVLASGHGGGEAAA